MQIEKDEQYIKTVVKLAGVVEGLIKCNNAIDIYEQYFPEVRVNLFVIDMLAWSCC